MPERAKISPCWVSAVAALVLLASAPAAASRQVAKAVPDAGPALAGSAVAWAESRPPRRGRGRSVLIRVGRGGRRTTLPTPEPPRVRCCDVSDSPATLLASESHVVLGRALEVCGVDICTLNSIDLVGGKWGKGRLGTIGRRRCGRELADGGPFAQALDRTVLAFGCQSGTRSSLLIRDLRGASADRFAAFRRHGVEARVAGRLLALKRDSGRREVIVVRNRLTRRVIYRARAGALGADDFGDWDLQADGKLAVAYRPRYRRGRAERTRLAWFSPGARPRKLAIQVAPYGIDGDLPSLRFARDRIAALVPRGGQRFDDLTNADLIVTSLTGDRHRVARFSHRRLRVGQIDFDGHRVTWAAQRVKRYKTDCPDNPQIGAPCLITPVGATGVFVVRPSARAG